MENTLTLRCDSTFRRTHNSTDWPFTRDTQERRSSRRVNEQAIKLAKILFMTTHCSVSDNLSKCCLLETQCTSSQRHSAYLQKQFQTRKCIFSLAAPPPRALSHFMFLLVLFSHNISFSRELCAMFWCQCTFASFSLQVLKCGRTAFRLLVARLHRKVNND